MNARLQIDCEKGGTNLEAIPLSGALPETTQLNFILARKLTRVDLARNTMADLSKEFGGNFDSTRHSL